MLAHQNSLHCRLFSVAHIAFLLFFFHYKSTCCISMVLQILFRITYYITYLKAKEVKE